MRIAGHFKRIETGATARTHHVLALVCSHCAFSVDPRCFKRAGDKSGLGRYNRALAKMRMHLHAEHRTALAAALPNTEDKAP